MEFAHYESHFWAGFAECRAEERCSVSGPGGCVVDHEVGIGESLASGNYLPKHVKCVIPTILLILPTEGYLLYSGSFYRLRFGFGLDLVCGVKNPVQGNGLHCDRLLHEAKKQLAAAFGSPPVESERELVQVVIEMLVANRSLVGPHQPSFEQGDDAVHSRHRLRWSLLLTPQECDVVMVALALQG